jgi:hypothetical protein
MRFPNTFGDVSIDIACLNHDRCYARSGTSRLVCDVRFALDIVDAFDGEGFFVERHANDVALIYFLGVRIGGIGPYDALPPERNFTSGLMDYTSHDPARRSRARGW